MRNRVAGAVLKSVRTLLDVGTSTGLSDTQLLEWYLLPGGAAAEAAFTALVERHGPMVLRACQGVLHDTHAAEDAFQATFLILARKAGSIRKRDSVASWLFGVARRVAGRSNVQRRQRALHETEWVAAVEAEAWTTDRPPEPISEIQEEVDRLPERYRAPIVLCYLEGLTNEEAASQLRLPASTVRVRLMRARTRLRDRLIRRGLGPAALMGIAARRAQAAVPAPLVDEIIKSAVEFAVGRSAGLSAPVAALVEGVIRAMLFAKLKMAACLLAALMLASLWLMSSLAGQAQPEPAPGVAKVPPAVPVIVGTPEPIGDGTEVTVVTVKRSRWGRTTTQPGTVIAAQSVDLYAKISGYLSMLRVDIGSRVKRGDVLAELFDPELAVKIEKARAEVDRATARVRKARAAIRVFNAASGTERAKVQAANTALEESETKVRYQKKQLVRVQELAKKGDVEQRVADETEERYASFVAGSNTARSQLEVARAVEAEVLAKMMAAEADVVEATSDHRIAEAGLHNAEIIAGYTKIDSPIDGIVTRRNYHVGEWIRSADVRDVSPIVTIVETKTMRVVVDVPVRAAYYPEEGDHAEVRLASLGARGVYKGQIARTAYALKPQDRTLRVEIDLSNTDGRLRPGQDPSVTIDLETKENVLTIPYSAISAGGADDTAVCYRVVAGRAVRASIKLGHVDGQRLEVLDGVKEGDVVIANPDARFRDGDAVKIRPETK